MFYFREIVDEFVNCRDFCRLLYIVVGECPRWESIANVFTNCTVEKHGLSGNNCDLITDLSNIVQIDWNIVNSEAFIRFPV